MTTNKPTRQLLIDHGLALISEKGLRGFAVRELAARAEVNLGSFVYHFGSREKFLDEIVELWYAPVYEKIKQATDDCPTRPAIERLQTSLTQILLLLAEHASFISHLLADALAGEAAAQRFLLTMPGRHPKLIFDLVQQAQQEGSLVAAHPLHLMLYLMMAAGVPVVLAGGTLRDCTWLPPQASMLAQLMSQPQLAQIRLTWALQGIRLPNHP